MGEDLLRDHIAPTGLAPASATPVADVEARFEQLLSDLRTAIADPIVAHRLETFDFNAVIRVREAEHLELWCLFHGKAEVDHSGHGAEADVEVAIPAALLEDFWTKHLAMEILEGRATYTGRVRTLLTMMPVIRAGVLRDTSAEVMA